jgi:uncharacterized protein YecE (DUF72 family)
MSKSTHRAIALPNPLTVWDNWPYRIGCPVWACKHWGDQVYPAKTPSDQFLDWYSRCFPTVEGNSTFYSVPPIATFEKWCERSAPGFRFCFKFPRTISHDLQLVGCEEPLRQWLERLEILARHNRLGPTFLQLAPSFSPRQFDSLAQLITQLPREWPWAVEVRHRDWYEDASCEERLNALLHTHGIDRVLFDSRPLNALDASDAFESASQIRKPKLPLRSDVTGPRPMVRLIGRNQIAEVDLYWEEWADRLAQWIRDGLQPWIFTHAPDDTFAPTLVRSLHERLQQRIPSLPSLPSLDGLLQAPPRDGGARGHGDHVAEKPLVQQRWF